MAKFFIDRPIFAWVISIFIIAAGISASKACLFRNIRLSPPRPLLCTPLIRVRPRR